MYHLFVYGDSLTWGIIPLSRDRLPFQARWPGVLETDLLAQGLSVRVTKDCLNGRRTVFPAEMAWPAWSSGSRASRPSTS